MSLVVGCPGAGRPPGTQAANQPSRGYPAGYAPCSRCGQLKRLRKDGRVVMHRVAEGDLIPMIRGVRYTSGAIRSRRR